MLNLVLKHPIALKTLLSQVRSLHGIRQKYFVCDKNIFSTTMAVRMFLMRCTRLSDGATRPTSFLKPNGLLQNLQRRQMSQLDVNINVQNNVFLYKYEKHNYYRNVKIFGVGQLFGWSILAFYTYTPSFWDIFTTDIKFREYWMNHMFRLSMFLFSLLAATTMTLLIYAICARSIKYIILNKGGETLTIVTYHFRKKKSTLNLPVGMVKCRANRTSTGVTLPLKILDKSFFYLVDKQGTFVNPKLFDYALG
ncbi:transmembrane protein 223 isoform X2 [Monomorium pharaonis]|uniref:transmembrane protein 223 isoform X2 n=1 Tax=Monomorium pharaonis TaxID=307658 RepID=UPI001747D081|nr:transmembrane protein 223 isoform X2 [Monomorium pharaonis]